MKQSNKIFWYLLPVVFIILTITFYIPHARCLVLKLTTEQLCEQAECIVIGTVTNLQSQWDVHGELIYTYITISNCKFIKGEFNVNELVIKNIGGVIGDIALTVPEVPEFNLNEQVLLFLNPGSTNLTDVVGGFQGKYTIKNNKLVELDIDLEDYITQLKQILSHS